VLQGARLRLVSALLAGAAALLHGGAATAFERHALIIGISRYQHVRALEGPRHDARAMRGALIDAWGFEPAHIAMLLDGDATRNRIQAELAALLERTRPGDYVLVYFSGHGTSRLDVHSPWPLPDGTGALIPADFTAEGTIEEQTGRLIVGRRDLRPVLEALDRGGRRVFVIVDSCFSGNAVRSRLAMSYMPLRYVALAEEAQVRETEPASLLDMLSAPPPPPYPYDSVMFLAASGEHEAATDIGRDLIERFPTSDGLPHGALTDTVLRVLTGRMQADTNDDGTLTYDELYRGVRQFMDERGYPQSPRLLPERGGEREALVARPLFELAQAPDVRAPEALDAGRVRVQVADDVPGLRAPLSGIDGVEIVTEAPDVLVQRGAAGVVLAAPGGDVIDSLHDADEGAIVARLQREVWVRRLLRAAPAAGAFNVIADLAVPQRRALVVEGEPIAFSVATEKAAYVVMLGIDPAANVSVLYPYDTDALPAPVAPGAPLRLPDDDPSSALRVASPFGIEHVVVAAMESRPAGLMRLAGRQVGPDSPLREDLERIFADAERRGAKASLRFRTVGHETLPQ
jgi:hypothetical protein